MQRYRQAIKPAVARLSELDGDPGMRASAWRSRACRCRRWRSTACACASPTQGSGPLVLLCHGFPELWISWRAQLAALAAAGFRAVAPDMRGYGGTDAPDDATAVHACCTWSATWSSWCRRWARQQAVIVGHDWGAPVAWNCGAAATRCLPRRGRHERALCAARAGGHAHRARAGGHPRLLPAVLPDAGRGRGRAGARRRRSDAPHPLQRVGRGQALLGRSAFGAVEPDKGFLGDTGRAAQPCRRGGARPTTAYYTAEFTRTGFRGGLNWYRNLRRSWELLAPWRGAGHPPAVAVHRRRQRRRAEVPELAAADRRLQQDPARPARLPHPGGRRALDAARACAGSQLAPDRVHQ